MLEVLGDARHRQDFLDEGFSTDFLGAAGDAVVVSPLRVDLAYPSRIAVAGGSEEDVWVEVSEVEVGDLGGDLCHSLNSTYLEKTRGSYRG